MPLARQLEEDITRASQRIVRDFLSSQLRECLGLGVQNVYTDRLEEAIASLNAALARTARRHQAAPERPALRLLS